ncbi:MAG: sodium:calcium antiporter [Burkholderiaceae bacterium]|nr:sodium:calcium antiporter [Burkholderiaceae bacterium]
MPDAVALLTLWSQLAACLLAIGFAGWWLSRCGGAIGAHTGMTGSLIGFTLLAGVTTLPELVTTVSALRFAHAPDIAVGGLLGSAVFNLAILAVLELLARGDGLYAAASRSHVLPAGLGAAMLALVGGSLILEHTTGAPVLAHVGVVTPLVLAAWLFSMRAMFRQEQSRSQKRSQAQLPTSGAATLGLRQALAGYGASAAVAVAAGSWLPFVAKALALAHGWEQSFVGTLLVAAITSAPELAVTLSAARLGALDMAIGNVLGANLLNVAMLGVGDLIYTAGPLLAAVSAMHMATAFSAVLMTLLFCAGLVVRARRGAFGRSSVIGLCLLLIYLINALFLFFGSSP